MNAFPHRPAEGEPILLWNQNVPLLSPGDDENQPTITPYFSNASEASAAIIVLPGGGYARRAPHEGEPVARWLRSLGISAFVADYRVAPYRHPVPLLDASRAVRYVRAHAAAWGIDPNRIGVLGFSAGGHLAATIATHFDDGEADAEDVIDCVSSRPNLAVLCYPVITMQGEHVHGGSRENLLGESPDEALVNHLSNEQTVGPDTPPTFLWHTADDASVPVENCLLFGLSLRRHGVPFELHVYEHGRHGLGILDEEAHVKEWTLACASWLKVRGF